MFVKLIFLCVLGLLIRIAYGQFDFDNGYPPYAPTGPFVNPDAQFTVVLDSRDFYIDFYGNRVERLKCLGDENLCIQYASSLVTCDKKRRWRCVADEESWQRDNIHFNHFEVKCEDVPMRVGPGAGFIDKTKCHLRYEATFKHKTLE